MKLETLTSLHIGSGNMLQKDSDFVFGKDAEDFSVVGVIDPRKVLALVGEENIDAWTVAIENGRSTNDIVKQYAPNATIADYSLHPIDSYLSRTPQQIKEFIRDGLDRPYIPGSSIKGAIRTAVLASIAATMNDADLRATRNKRLRQSFLAKTPTTTCFDICLAAMPLPRAIAQPSTTW